MQSLIVAEVSEAAVPLGNISGAVAEDLALHLGGRQAGPVRLLLPVNQHHRVPAGAVRGGLAGVVGTQLAGTLQTCNTASVKGLLLCGRGGQKRCHPLIGRGRCSLTPRQRDTAVT